MIGAVAVAAVGVGAGGDVAVVSWPSCCVHHLDLKDLEETKLSSRICTRRCGWSPY